MGVIGLTREVLSIPVTLARPAAGLVYEVARSVVSDLRATDNDLDRAGTDLSHRRRRIWEKPGRAHIEVLGEALNRAIIERAIVTTLGTAGGWTAARLTGRRTRANTVALASLVATELGQTLLTGWRSPLVPASGIGSMAALVGVVQTPGLSQLFGCTPLGPLAWSQALTSAGLATMGSFMVTPMVARMMPATILSAPVHGRDALVP